MPLQSMLNWLEYLRTITALETHMSWIFRLRLTPRLRPHETIPPPERNADV